MIISPLLLVCDSLLIHRLIERGDQRMSLFDEASNGFGLLALAATILGVTAIAPTTNALFSCS